MKDAPPVTVLLLFGNDDHHILEPLLDALAAEGLCVNLNGRVHREAGLVFGGMNKVLWMIHQPPSDLGLDICSDGRRVGSPTVLQFIREQQPLLGCSGHIHESPHQPGGQWGVQVGRTLWLQPGQLDRRLHYVTVNLGLDFEIRSARHSLFGELRSHPVAPVPIGSASSPSPQPQPLLVASHATAAAAPASIPVDGRPPPATRSTPSPDSAAGCSRC